MTSIPGMVPLFFKYNHDNFVSAPSHTLWKKGINQNLSLVDMQCLPSQMHTYTSMVFPMMGSPLEHSHILFIMRQSVTNYKFLIPPKTLRNTSGNILLTSRYILPIITN